MFECIYKKQTCFRCTIKWRHPTNYFRNLRLGGDPSDHVNCPFDNTHDTLAAFCQVLETSWQTGDLATQAPLHDSGWRVKGETILIIFGERGGVKKHEQKTCRVFFVFWIFFNYGAWEFDFFNSKKQDESSPKQVYSRSIVLHRCLQLFVRFLGIWNKWCDIIDTISNRSREISCGMHQSFHIPPLVGGLGVWKRSKWLLLQMQFWAPDHMYSQCILKYIANFLCMIQEKQFVCTGRW